MSDPYLMLRTLAHKCRSLEEEVESARRSRDQAALALVAEGHTWRDVADAAGFANPYIATLKRKAKAEQPPCSHNSAKMIWWLNGQPVYECPECSVILGYDGPLVEQP